MTKNTETARQIVLNLLDIGAIKLNPDEPFIWASGWRSPIYCDNRLALSYPEIRDYIKHALSSTIRDHFKGAEVVAGVATAGIPQGALVADELNLPFIYVRSKPKGHGLTNQIEGRIVPDQKVVVIEDLVSTGGSSLKAVQAIRDSGMNVMGMVSIFTYGFDLSIQNFQKANVPYMSLSDYDTLINVGIEEDLIPEAQITRLKAWRKTPDSWK